MERQLPTTLDYGEASITIKNKPNDSAEVIITMSEQTLNEFVVEVARRRGKAIADTVGEALRLGILHYKTADNENSGLFIRENLDQFRKLLKA